MIGKIVCSKAGSDKGCFLVVTGICENRFLVADGKRYKISSPKSKNPKHLAPTEKTLVREEYLTDKQLRKALAVFTAKHSKE